MNTNPTDIESQFMDEILSVGVADSAAAVTLPALSPADLPASLPVPAVPPHRQRVLDERAELGDRLSKLVTFQQSGLFHSLDKDEQVLLNEQAGAMRRYAKILDQRIELWGVMT